MKFLLGRSIKMLPIHLLQPLVIL
ncbi:hypothetical protein L345_10434 [Ophiophagus hannah]|uniref:Uncharacterized protein n=1 Tax=Ophiophagus hannah TaxID=8665 RepID=V8NQ43_OPHHA|nr:hypothetical protein L345_10434 [Ophiophagus hannah]